MRELFGVGVAIPVTLAVVATFFIAVNELYIKPKHEQLLADRGKQYNEAAKTYAESNAMDIMQKGKVTVTLTELKTGRYIDQSYPSDHELISVLEYDSVTKMINITTAIGDPRASELTNRGIAMRTGEYGAGSEVDGKMYGMQKNYVAEEQEHVKNLGGAQLTASVRPYQPKNTPLNITTLPPLGTGYGKDGYTRIFDISANTTTIVQLDGTETVFEGNCITHPELCDPNKVIPPTDPTKKCSGSIFAGGGNVTKIEVIQGNSCSTDALSSVKYVNGEAFCNKLTIRNGSWADNLTPMCSSGMKLINDTPQILIRKATISERLEGKGDIKGLTVCAFNDSLTDKTYPQPVYTKGCQLPNQIVVGHTIVDKVDWIEPSNICIDKSSCLLSDDVMLVRQGSQSYEKEYGTYSVCSEGFTHVGYNYDAGNNWDDLKAVCVANKLIAR